GGKPNGGALRGKHVTCSVSFYFSFHFSVAFAHSFLWTSPRSGSCSALIRSPGLLRTYPDGFFKPVRHFNSRLIKIHEVRFR
ncbi:unnamed protein product, partial [Musa textilis]